MESGLEVTLWFVFAMAVGLLILNFTTNIDYLGFADSVKGFFSGQKSDIEKLEMKNLDETIIATLDLWKECGFGEVNRSIILRYNDSRILNKTTYFNFIKDINLCHVISSSSNNCGDREELDILGNIQNDKFIKVRCDLTTSKMIISTS